MTTSNTIKLPTDAISMLNRGIRIGVGFAILFGTLSILIIGDDAYPIINLVAIIAILTGTISYKPFYTALGDIMTRKLRTKPYGYLVRRRYA